MHADFGPKDRESIAFALISAILAKFHKFLIPSLLKVRGAWMKDSAANLLSMDSLSRGAHGPHLLVKIWRTIAGCNCYTV